MDDYIKRDEILAKQKTLHEIQYGTGSRTLVDVSAVRVSDVESIPAADVRPVVRGHWVKARGSWCTPGGDPVWECSECGKGVHVYGIEHGTYGSDIADGQWVSCPNCGAKMGGTP